MALLALISTSADDCGEKSSGDTGANERDERGPLNLGRRCAAPKENAALGAAVGAASSAAAHSRARRMW